MYEGFCYFAFTNGILKYQIDDMEWNDLAVLLHQHKIDQEDQIVKILEMDEGKSSDFKK